MRMRALQTLLALVLASTVIATEIVWSTPVAAADDGTVAGIFGDSFASGEGLMWNDTGEDLCQRALGRSHPSGTASKAWGISVLEDFRIRRKMPEKSSWFAACTGAHSVHFKTTAQHSSLGTQYLEARQGTGESLFDVVFASFGGNDLGFESVIFDCLGLDDAATGAVGGTYLGGWAGGLVAGGAGLLYGGCRDGLDGELRTKIDGLAKDELPALYAQLAESTAQGALIVVAGYPQLFEDPATSWNPEATATGRCHGIQRDDADMLRGVQARFNDVLAQQVRAASERHPERSWVFADVSTRFHGKGLCSRERDEWLNGLTSGWTGGTHRLARSFHPNQNGHTFGYAHAISRMKVVNDWRPSPRPRLISEASVDRSDPALVAEAFVRELLRGGDPGQYATQDIIDEARGQFGEMVDSDAEVRIDPDYSEAEAGAKGECAFTAHITYTCYVRIDVFPERRIVTIFVSPWADGVEFDDEMQPLDPPGDNRVVGSQGSPF